MDIIQYLLSIIQYLYRQNCRLVNFIVTVHGGYSPVLPFMTVKFSLSGLMHSSVLRLLQQKLKIRPYFLAFHYGYHRKNSKWIRTF